MEKICGVIVSYNSADELKKCIYQFVQSASRAGLKPMPVVVDNNSRDNSVRVAGSSGAEIIANTTNLGFAAAVNQGILHGKKNKCELFLVLNPDAVLQPDTLLHMMVDLKLNGVGAVGPEMLDTKGKPANSGYYLKAPSWLSVLLFSTPLGRYSRKSRLLRRMIFEEMPLVKSREVAQIPGACLLTSKEVLDKVGLLDEDYAIWFEDVDWCYRARKLGYKMWFCSSAQVEHRGGSSFEKWVSLDKAVTFYVSMKTFFRKHKPISYIAVVSILTANSLIIYLLSRDKSNLVFLKKFLKQKRGLLPN
jgi:GT2 family glycosyltransferase